MLKIGYWILVFMCLYGQYLVTKCDKWGFILWIVADTFWTISCFINYKIPGNLEQGCLWLAYTILSTWGLIRWYKIHNQVKQMCNKERNYNENT